MSDNGHMRTADSEDDMLQQNSMKKNSHINFNEQLVEIL
jgi:hypothetical protein